MSVYCNLHLNSCNSPCSIVMNLISIHGIATRKNELTILLSIINCDPHSIS